MQFSTSDVPGVDTVFEARPVSMSPRTTRGGVAAGRILTVVILIAAIATIVGPDAAWAIPPGPPPAIEPTRVDVESRVAIARRFLASLDDDQRSRASAAITAPDRGGWSYLPGPRSGVRLEELDADQRVLWEAFLARSLSPAGVRRVERIRATEPVHDRGGGVFTGPEVYAIRFHGLDGTPATTPRAWSWRIEGHHLHLGETIVDDRIVSATPFMLGSVRRRDPSGEVFEAEDAAAARLLAGVPADRIEHAWAAGPMPGDLRTAMHPATAWRLEGGVPLAEAGEHARAIADDIVGGLLRLRPENAIAAIRTAWEATPDEEIRFAWVGDRDRTRTHQWRLVAPALVVEFSHSGGDANHGHLVLRHPGGESAAIDGDWTAAP